MPRTDEDPHECKISYPYGVTGDYHTHGAKSPGWKDEEFSKADKTVVPGIEKGFLGTPNDKVKAINYKTGKQTELSIDPTTGQLVETDPETGQEISREDPTPVNSSDTGDNPPG